MREKDLYKYRDCKNNEKRLLERLRELEARQASIRSPCASATPADHDGDPCMKLVENIDRIERLRGQITEARRETDLAEIQLETVRRVLDDERERQVFDMLYFHFLTIEETARKIAYSVSRVYQLRRSILNRVASL